MKQKHDKIEKKLRNLANKAERMVGKRIFEAEDSVLVGNPASKSAKMENFLGKTPEQHKGWVAMKLATNFRMVMNNRI